MSSLCYPVALGGQSWEPLARLGGRRQARICVSGFPQPPPVFWNRNSVPYWISSPQWYLLQNIINRVKYWWDRLRINLCVAGECFGALLEHKYTSTTSTAAARTEELNNNQGIWFMLCRTSCEMAKNPSHQVQSFMFPYKSLNVLQIVAGMQTVNVSFFRLTWIMIYFSTRSPAHRAINPAWQSLYIVHESSACFYFCAFSKELLMNTLFFSPTELSYHNNSYVCHIQV